MPIAVALALTGVVLVVAAGSLGLASTTPRSRRRERQLNAGAWIFLTAAFAAFLAAIWVGVTP